MIPVLVRYDLESVATLQSLPECPYVHIKHVDFNFFNNSFLCDIIIWLIWFWGTDSYYNKVQYYKQNNSKIKSLKSQYVLKQYFVFNQFCNRMILTKLVYLYFVYIGFDTLLEAMFVCHTASELHFYPCFVHEGKRVKIM